MSLATHPPLSQDDGNTTTVRILSNRKEEGCVSRVAVSRRQALPAARSRVDASLADVASGKTLGQKVRTDGRGEEENLRDKI